jgi:hypothetical protein
MATRTDSTIFIHIKGKNINGPQQNKIPDFTAAKRAPGYPGRFLDLKDSVQYFERYFQWYNTENLHSGIDCVTSDQCHLGLRDQIVSERRAKLDKEHRLRKQLNRYSWEPSPVLSGGFTTLSTLCHVA